MELKPKTIKLLGENLQDFRLEFLVKRTCKEKW
jgi:hypothetical protein